MAVRGRGAAGAEAQFGAAPNCASAPAAPLRQKVVLRPNILIVQCESKPVETPMKTPISTDLSAFALSYARQSHVPDEQTFRMVAYLAKIGNLQPIFRLTGMSFHSKVRAKWSRVERSGFA